MNSIGLPHTSCPSNLALIGRSHSENTSKVIPISQSDLKKKISPRIIISTDQQTTLHEKEYLNFLTLLLSSLRKFTLIKQLAFVWNWTLQYTRKEAKGKNISPIFCGSNCATRSINLVASQNLLKMKQALTYCDVCPFFPLMWTTSRALWQLSVILTVERGPVGAEDRMKNSDRLVPCFLASKDTGIFQKIVLNSRNIFAVFT